MTDRREFMHALLAAAAVSQAGSVAAGQSAAAQAPSAPAPAPAPSAATPGASRRVLRQPLAAPFEGREATFIEVTIQPGPGSRPHRHAGFVLGYVLEGEMLFATQGETPRVVKAGEAFYEGARRGPLDLGERAPGSSRPDPRDHRGRGGRGVDDL